MHVFSCNYHTINCDNRLISVSSVCQYLTNLKRKQLKINIDNSGCWKKHTNICVNLISLKLFVPVCYCLIVCVDLDSKVTRLRKYGFTPCNLMLSSAWYFIFILTTKKTWDNSTLHNSLWVILRIFYTPINFIRPTVFFCWKNTNSDVLYVEHLP